MAKDLSPEELSFITALFTRVGIYVSNCDDTDRGDQSEEEEKAHMMRALHRVAKISKYPQISQAASAAVSTLTVPDDKNGETLNRDIRKAVQFFKAYESFDALREFHRALMYVGTMVARAYREELDHHEDEFLLESFLNKVCGHVNQEADPKEFKNANVSPAENTALSLISEALKS